MPAESDDPHDDPMAPPTEPCECWCMHCNRTFMSDQMWFQKVINDPGGFPGFWMCPTNNCDGVGYKFDIFPIDPEHPDNEGWHYSDDDDEFDEEEFDEEDESADAKSNGEKFDGSGADKSAESGEFKDQPFSFPDDDESDDNIEGEEWKYGIDPFAPQDEIELAKRQKMIDDEEAKYDLPDERPRVLDWKDREQRPFIDGGDSDGRSVNEDDIPF